MLIQTIDLYNNQKLNMNNRKNIFRTTNVKNVDSISFAGRLNLLKKYNITPENLPVISTSGIHINLQEKIELIQKILEGHEQALKNKLTGNIANAGYATNIKLANGQWHLATNFNNTRNEISAICGERSATLGLFNKWLQSLSLRKLQKNPIYREASQQDNAFKVKYLAMSSYKDIGTDKNAASPCADCLSWLDTERFFCDDTRIASLENNEQGKLSLKIRTVKESLPYRQEKDSLITNGKKLNELDYTITSNAERVMAKNEISQDDILRLMQDAQNKYSDNLNINFSNQNISAAVLDTENRITTGKKIDWSKRWFMEPLEFAISKAVENAPISTRIKAIAYYGQGIINDKGIVHKDGVVSLQTLGRLKTEKGSSETLVVTVVENKITIRTIDDYMPEKFSFIQDYFKK